MELDLTTVIGIPSECVRTPRSYIDGSRLGCGDDQACEVLVQRCDTTWRAGRFDERLKVLPQTARENPDSDWKLPVDALITDMTAAVVRAERPMEDPSKGQGQHRRSRVRAVGLMVGERRCGRLRVVASASAR